MRLAAIATYPVKGAHRLDHDSAQVQTCGLVGDRRWMIIDEEGYGLTQRGVPALVGLHPAPTPGGLLLRAPGRPELPLSEPVDGEPVEVQIFRGKPSFKVRRAAPAADDWLSDLLGQPARLVWLDDPAARPTDPAYFAPGDQASFADGFPVLLANRASLDAVNEMLVEVGDVEAPLPMTRFRPNLVVSGALPWAEDGWVGHRVRVGSMTFRVAKPCNRCVVTTTDQETGERGHQPLRILGARRRFGRELHFGVCLLPDGTGRVEVGDPIELVD